MKLKRRFLQEWTQPVNPVILCIYVLLITLLIVGRGLYLLETGHAPRLGPGFWFLSLCYLGAHYLIDMVGSDRRAFTLTRMTLLSGYVLLAVSQIINQGSVSSVMLEVSGFVVIGATLLINMFDLGGRETK